MKSEITATFFPLYILAWVNNNWTNFLTDWFKKISLDFSSLGSSLLLIYDLEPTLPAPYFPNLAS